MSKKDRDLGVSDVIEILDWLEEAHVDLWLGGGWDRDAVLALFVDSEHSAPLITALEAHGFAVTERGSPDAFVLEDANGRQAGVHCARIDALGNGLDRMKAVMIGRSLRLQGQGTIGDRRVRCMTPELQMRCKTGDSRQAQPTTRTCACCTNGSARGDSSDVPQRSLAA